MEKKVTFVVCNLNPYQSREASFFSFFLKKWFLKKKVMAFIYMIPITFFFQKVVLKKKGDGIHLHDPHHLFLS